MRAEQGEHPPLVVQTVSQAQVTATVLAIRYRRPGELEAPSPSAAHLLEHLLFRSRVGSPPGALLVRSESLGGQSRAYLTSGLLVLAELVPSEQGLDSLDLQLERLRAIPSDAADLSLEKRAIGGEISGTQAGVEELARRDLLARLGVNAQVEGDAEALAALTPAELEKLVAGLDLERDVVIAVVGPHSDREVRQHLSKGLKKLKPARTEARKRAAASPPVGQTRVISPAGYQQQSFFLTLPELSAAELLLLQELLSHASNKRSEANRFTLAVEKEDLGLYRLDVRPAATADQLVRLLRTVDLTDEALNSRLRRRWLDLYEPALERAEMLALEALDRGTPARPLPESELPQTRQRLLVLLEDALQQAPSLILEAEQQNSGGLFPFKTRARAGAELQREKLANGLRVAWQDLKAWPVVAISGFFRLRQRLSAEECGQLEAKLEARSPAGLDYDIRPDALFFHLWCPSAELTRALETSAAEIRALSLSAELLLDSANPSPAGLLEDFFLAGLQRPEPSAVSGRNLLLPDVGQLVLVGDIDPVALEHGLRPAWNGWFADKPGPPADPISLSVPPTEVHRTVSVAAGQTPLLLLGIWGPSRSNPDFLAFNLVLQTLAGRPTTSLLARDLRDTEGLIETVSVAPLTGSERSDGRQLWLLALRPRQAVEEAAGLVEKAQTALDGLAREPLPEAELARTRAFLKAALRLSTSTSRGRARMLANSEFYRLSEQYSTDYAGLYDRIDANHAQAVWQKYLSGQTPRWLYLRPDPQGGEPTGG